MPLRRFCGIVIVYYHWEVLSLEQYIIIALLAAVIILLIILLVRQGRDRSPEIASKVDSLGGVITGLSGNVSSVLERSRRESLENQNAAREENRRVLENMDGRIERMRLDNTEAQARMENSVLKSLTEIRINDSVQNEKLSKTVSEALDKMRESNENKLEQMRETVDEKLTSTLTSRLDTSFRTVSDRLESVYKSLGEMKELSNGVTANVTALNRVLTNVKARGTWAEVQLGAILDQTIPGMYETNFAPVPGSKDRVEFAVKIPSGEENTETTYLPIDSKFPMEDYIRLCDAADSGNSAALEAARKALIVRIYGEAKSVSKYINVPRTTPFAILYLATEGLYAEIAASRTGISEKIRSDFNVMLAGPSTITALLNSLSLGFRAVAINEKANEVRLLLAAAKVQYDKFGTVLQKAKQKIDEAGKTLDEADKRNEMIRRKLRRVEEIDPGEADGILGTDENDFNDI